MSEIPQTSTKPKENQHQNLGKFEGVRTSVTSDSDTPGTKIPHPKPFPPAPSLPCALYPHTRRPPPLMPCRTQDFRRSSLCLRRRFCQSPGTIRHCHCHPWRTPCSSGVRPNAIAGYLGVVVVDFKGNTMVVYSVKENELLCEAWSTVWNFKA